MKKINQHCRFNGSNNFGDRCNSAVKLYWKFSVSQWTLWFFLSVCHRGLILYISLLFIFQLLLYRHCRCCFSTTNRSFKYCIWFETSISHRGALCQCAVSLYFWSFCLSAIASSWTHLWMFPTCNGGDVDPSSWSHLNALYEEYFPYFLPDIAVVKWLK